MLTPVVNRTLHTYHSVLRILCQAFELDTDGRDFKCEKRLIEEAHKHNARGMMLVPIVDDAHLMHTEALRRLRLLFEDFPKNHNLVLFGQPELLYTLCLAVHEDIRSRVTYSAKLLRLAPDDLRAWIFRELDRVALAHATFTPDALSLIVRSGDGILRRTRNLCVASLLEAVRDRTRTVDLPQVNRVLLQPHWRQDRDIPEVS
jgi:type II secretory pathway predicted ATPase ExeA